MEALITAAIEYFVEFGITAAETAALVGKIRTVKWLGDFLQKHVDDHKLKTIIRGIAYFEKYGLLDNSIRNKIENMTPDEWDTIAGDVMNAIDASDNEAKLLLNKNLMLAYMNKNIAKAGVQQIRRALKDLPTDDLLALCQATKGMFATAYNNATGPLFESLKPYGLISSKITNDSWSGELSTQYNLSPLGLSFYTYVLMPIGMTKIRELLPGLPE